MNLFNEVMIRVERNTFGIGGYSFYYATREDSNSHLLVAKSITFEQIEKGMAVHTPMLELEHDDCVKLMNELWVAGIRPSKGLMEPQATHSVDGEVAWLRGTVDHLMKKTVKQ